MRQKPMIDTTKMSARGQVVMPKGIRDFIGAEEDTLFAVSALDKDTVVFKRLDLTEQFRILRRDVKPLSQKEIEEEIHAARRARH
jgi:bifunctional DNA-binding transcriptional regulator/antitoxin component of YhaV-PrlF toxin-antitoxin module